MMMSAETAKKVKATLDGCEGWGSEWIWEQVDDLWGIIRLKTTNQVLTVNWGTKNLDIRDLYPEDTKYSQMWRWLDNMLTKYRATMVLTAGEDGRIKAAYKSKDDKSQRWEMVHAEEALTSPCECEPYSLRAWHAKQQRRNRVCPWVEQDTVSHRTPMVQKVAITTKVGHMRKWPSMEQVGTRMRPRNH